MTKIFNNIMILTTFIYCSTVYSIETNIPNIGIDENCAQYDNSENDILESFSVDNLNTKDANNVENNKIIDNINQNKTVKILSLDGGGTYGYMQAKFLDKFCKEAGIQDIGNYFDLIAGTSIGGMNAVAVADGISPDYIMNFFRTQAPWIFTVRSIKDVLKFSNNASYPSNKPNKLQLFCMGLVSNPFYKSKSPTSNYGSSRLRNELTNIFQEKKIPELKTNVLLTAYNYSEYAPVIFTNAEIKHIPDTYKNLKIVDAVMATASAPIYFPSTKLKLSPDPTEPEYNIMDGGLFQNNPSSLAYAVAQMIYPEAKKMCILSIGTGNTEIGLHISSEIQEPSNTAILQFTNLYKILMKNSQIDNDILFTALNSNKYSNVSYYRFNIQLDNNHFGIDDSEPEFFDYLDKAVDAKYLEDNYKINRFITKLNGVNNDGLIV